MSGARVMVEHLEAAALEMRRFRNAVQRARVVARIVPIRAALPASYGSAPRLNPVFTSGRGNTCPSCNAQSWFVGRISAECAQCKTVLDVVQSQTVYLGGGAL